MATEIATETERNNPKVSRIREVDISMSITAMSLENRVRMRPVVFASKNCIFDLAIRSVISLCMPVPDLMTKESMMKFLKKAEAM